MTPEEKSALITALRKIQAEINILSVQVHSAYSHFQAENMKATGKTQEEFNQQMQFVMELAARGNNENGKSTFLEEYITILEKDLDNK